MRWNGRQLFVIQQPLLCMCLSFSVVILIWSCLSLTSTQIKLHNGYKCKKTPPKLALVREQIVLGAVRSSLQIYFSAGDTHSLCVFCLRAEHAKSALEGACGAFFSLCMRALGGFLKLSEPSPAFLAMSVPISPMWSGGYARGNCRWIRWGERRRAIPYLLPFPLNPAPTPWVRKSTPRILPLEERA